jgi:hypothetical protein
MTTHHVRVRLVGSAAWGALATGVLAAVALLLPRDLAVASLVYVIVLGSLTARLLVQVLALTAGTPALRPFDLAFRRTPSATGVAADPAKIAFELRSSLDVPSTLHFRLRPRLRAIAADRLAAGHGVSLDRDPDSARRLLGDDAWELLRADRDLPSRGRGSAISTTELERIVAAVERL